MSIKNTQLSQDKIINFAAEKDRRGKLSPRELLLHLCPTGRFDGGEFIVEDATLGGSVKLNLKNWQWKNFTAPNGPGGRSRDTFLAYVLGIEESEVKAKIAELGAAAVAPANDTLEIMVAPGAPSPAKLRLTLQEGELAVPPSKMYYYGTPAEKLIMVVARYETKRADGTPDKRIAPWVWGRRVWADKNGKIHDRIGWHCKNIPSDRPLYGLVERVRAPTKEVLIVEGEKAVQGARKLLPNYVSMTSAGGAQAAEKSDWSPMRGAHVIIFPDHDKPGLDYASSVNRLAQAAGAASVRQVEIPKTWPEGWDLGDPLPPGVTPADLLEMINNAPRPKAVIFVDPGNLHHMVDEAEAAIIASGEAVYQRGRALVRPTTVSMKSSEDGIATIAASLSPMNTHALRDVLSRVSTWVKFDPETKKIVVVATPEIVALALLSRAGLWKFPTIAGVITCPTIRRDGSLLVAPGYDAVTRLYHMADPSLVVTVKDCPTRADAVAALKLLEGLLVEFPFVQKGKTSVSRSVALATMLSTVARGCMDVVPLSAFNAHVAGTGKTYLVNLISTIATGRPCPVISINPADPAEAEKRIASALLAGYPLVSLDNVNGELRSDLLCQAVEQPLLRVRVFGVLELVEIENTASFVTTGNNLKLVADLTRRSLRGDLDAVMERPDQRLFGHDPIGIVRADRGKFVSACLTIVRAFQVAGCPGKPLTPMVSYGQWTKFIRAPLVWLGQPDPAESVEAARDDDPELEALTSFITVFDTTKNALVRAIATQPSKRTAADGFSVQELTTFHSPESDLADFTILQEFKDALKRIAPGRDDTDPKKLGKWLSKHEGRVVRVAPLDTTTPVISAAIKGDRFLRLSRNGTATSGGVKWLLEETKG